MWLRAQKEKSGEIAGHAPLSYRTLWANVLKRPEEQDMGFKGFFERAKNVPNKGLAL